MPTYLNTIIYKIICKDENVKECYVGHTTNLKSRIAEHKYNCTNDKSKSHNVKLYTTIREKGGWDNWSIEKIEDYPCQTKQEATIREHYHYFIIGSTLNDISPVLDVEKIIQHKKKKSSELKELTRLKREQKKEERLKYLEEHKEEIKQHQIELRKIRDLKNREKLTEDMRNYRANNKEKISEINKRAYEKRKKNGYYEKKD